MPPISHPNPILLAIPLLSLLSFSNIPVLLSPWRAGRLISFPTVPLSSWSSAFGSDAKSVNHSTTRIKKTDRLGRTGGVIERRAKRCSGELTAFCNLFYNVKSNSSEKKNICADITSPKSTDRFLSFVALWDTCANLGRLGCVFSSGDASAGHLSFTATTTTPSLWLKWKKKRAKVFA